MITIVYLLKVLIAGLSVIPWYFFGIIVSFVDQETPLCQDRCRLN